MTEAPLTMPKKDILSSVTAVVLPLLASLALVSCGGGAQGTCTAFDLTIGDSIAVDGGAVISLDDCFATCRETSTLFDCRFTPSPSQSSPLPVEPVI